MERGLQRTLLLESAGQLRLALTDDQIDRLLNYLALLVRWNATYNLTAIRDPHGMLVQHLVDCLAVVRPLQRWAMGRVCRIVDVGSGGGLPGVVLAVADPTFTVCCVDSVGKKTAFVQQVAAELRLANLSARHARIEQIGARFDLAISRAFASLGDFVRLTQPVLDGAAVRVAMKGKMPSAELQELDPAVEVFHVEPLEVPGLGAERRLIWLRDRHPEADA